MEGDGGADKPNDSGGERPPGEPGGEKRDIRRPMNAFLIFCKRHRSMVREKHPDRDNRSVTRILGDLWANLAEDEKSVYTKLAKQYKDAFMKANPDYKWHSTDRLPQPAKMATRPTNVRPPRSLSTSDCPVSTQAADGDKMGGVNLLIMAGQQSQQPVMSHVLERRVTSPDLATGNNFALLQLAEMCSSRLHGHQEEPVRTTPPKSLKKRHRSHSDIGHTDTGSSHFSRTPLIIPTLPSHPTPLTTTTTSITSTQSSATTTSQSAEKQGVAVVQSRTVGHEPAVSADQTAVTGTTEENLKPSLSPEARKMNTSRVELPKPAQDRLAFQPEVKSEVTVPPKKKFTKLQDVVVKNEHQSPAVFTSSSNPAVPTATNITTTTPTTPTTPTCSAEGGCLSDQNDNAIFTCGKLMVDHIIDRLFSANLAASANSSSGGSGSEKNQCADASLSSQDIERVRNLITADIKERETSQGPGTKQMGKLLSEVVRKPQSLVEKVIEEAYSLKHRAKLEPTAAHLHAASHPPVTSSQGVPKMETTTTATWWAGKQEPQNPTNNTSTVAPATSVRHDLQGRLEPIAEQHSQEAKPQPSSQELPTTLWKIIPSSTSPAGTSILATHSTATVSVSSLAVIPPTSVSLLHHPSSTSGLVASLVSAKPTSLAASPPAGCIVVPPVAVTTSQSAMPLPHSDMKEEAEDQYCDEAAMGELGRDDTADFLMQEEEDAYSSSQPLRKSRRRNRGQRYQELINEGIIQPSKERLAARRHEQGPSQMPSYAAMSMFYPDDGGEDDRIEERPRHQLKRSISESDSNPGDEKRYRTGDFDLEAEIATLPPCSLDQVSRRRPQRKRSDSESSRKAAKDEVVVSEVTGPLTGSQKRKARKHSISRLTASADTTNTDCSVAAGIAASLPMVRDATISPTRGSQLQPASPTVRPSASQPVTEQSASQTVASSTSSSTVHSTKTVEGKCERIDGKEGPVITVTTGNAGRTFNSKTAPHSSSASETNSAVIQDGKHNTVCDPVKSDTSLLLKNASVSIQKDMHVSSSFSSKKDNHSTEEGKLISFTERGASVPNKTENLVIDAATSKPSRVSSNIAPTSGSDLSLKHCLVEKQPAMVSFSTSQITALDTTRVKVNMDPHPSEMVLCKSTVIHTADGESASAASHDPRESVLKNSMAQRSSLKHSQEASLNLECVASIVDSSSTPAAFLSGKSGTVHTVTASSGFLTALTEAAPLGRKRVKEKSEKLSSASPTSPSRTDSVLSASRTEIKGTRPAPDQQVQNPLAESILATYRPELGSSVAMETSDSQDSGSEHSTVGAASSGYSTDMLTSPYSSSSSTVQTAAEPCLTSVTLSNSGAIPQAVALEMMQEGEVVDSGVGGSLLCSSLPGSPSVTAVHS